MNPKKVKKVFSSVFFSHPLPIGTRIKCKDGRFAGGYITGRIRRYCQGYRVTGDIKEINLRRAWTYALNYGWNRIYKSPETVMEILE